MISIQKLIEQKCYYQSRTETSEFPVYEHHGIHQLPGRFDYILRRVLSVYSRVFPLDMVK